MSRQARKKSETGIYHIMLRGVNKQVIFEDDQDRIKFISVLKKTKMKSEFKIYAYCLMSNHVHLLMQEGDEPIGSTMKRIAVSYVYWYNWKHERYGHLFQDRFRSEAIDSESYFLTALRYIHQNPVKAGIVKKIEDYHWCSYMEYLMDEDITDTDYALKIFCDDKSKSKETFKAFHQELNDDRCLDIEERKRLRDRQAIEIIQRVCQIKSPTELKNYEYEKRKALLNKLKNEGISTRQLERLTGISRGIILKA